MSPGPLRRSWRGQAWPALLSSMLFALPQPATGQPTWSLGRPLPEMHATFCISVESAAQMAAQASDLSIAKPAGCYRSRIRATPQRSEGRIGSLSLQEFQYAPTRDNPVRHRWNGIEHRVDVVIAMSSARVYMGRIQLADGRELTGWIFIVDDPYPLAYARATGARIMP
jgi:hypothetical protein